MADGGRIVTEAALDLAQFRAGMAQLQQAVKAVNDSMESIKPAKPRLDTSGFEKDVQGARRAAKDFTEELTGINLARLINPATAAAAAIAGIGVAIGAVTVAAFKLGEAFDDASDTIRIATGKTGDALAELENDFQAVFGSIPASMKDVARVTADLSVRLGVTGEDLQNISRTVLELSRLTGTDATTNARLAARAFQDWGVATKDAEGALDLLFRTTQATGIPIQKLQELMVQFGAPLRALGFGFTEAAALLGKFEREGVNVEQVLGSMRIALSEFASAGLPAEQTLRDVILAIRDAEDATEALTLANEVFGRRAGADVFQAIREERFEIEALATTIGEGTDTIAAAADATNDAAQKFQIAVNQMVVALAPLGKAAFEAGTAIVEELLPQVDKIIARLPDFIRALQQTARWVKLAFGGSADGETNIQNALKLAQDIEKALGLTEDTGSQAEVATEGFDQAEQGAKRVAKSVAEMRAELRQGKQEVQSFADQLRAAGQDTALIESLLRNRDAVQLVEKAINSLTDRGIAAAIVALRNKAEASTDAAEKEGLLAQAAELAAGHLEAQGVKAEKTGKTLQEMIDDETRSRLGSVFGPLIANTDAATAGLAKMRQESGDTEGALELLLAQASGGQADFESLKAGLLAGGTAAIEAREKIAALTEFVRSNGSLRLKIQVDIEETRKQIGDLQSNFRESSARLAQEEAKATAAHAANLGSINRARDDSFAGFTQGMRSLEAARTASTQQLGRDISSAVASANEATSKIGQARTDAIAANAQAFNDAADKFDLEMLDSAAKYADATRALADQATDGIKQVTDAQISAFRQLAAAQGAFNDQQRQGAAQASIALQNAQLQALGLDPNAAPTGGTFGSKTLAQIQQEGQAALAQQSAADAFNRTRASAQQQAADAQTKAAEALDKIAKDLADATAERDKAQGKAQDDFTKTVRDIDKAFAKAMRDLALQEEQANQALTKALRQSFEEDKKRQKDLNDQEQALQEKFLKEQADIQRQLQEAERQFQEEEARRRKDQADLEKKFQQDLLKLQQQLRDQIARLPGDTADALAARINASPQEFEFQKVVNQETSVDFLRVTPGRLLDRVKSGV